MSNMLCEILDERIMESYKMDILSEGNIRLFFPVSYLKGNEGELISYVDVEGYIRLKDVKTIDGVRAIDLIGMMADSMRDAMDNYIFPEEYMVNEDTVYVDKRLKRIKLIFRGENQTEHHRGVYGYGSYIRGNKLGGGEGAKADSIYTNGSVYTNSAGLIGSKRMANVAEARDVDAEKASCIGNAGTNETILYEDTSALGFINMGEDGVETVNDNYAYIREAPTGPGPIYDRVRSLADILAEKVGQGAAGPIWEAARLFRAEGYGLAAALRDCAEIRRQLYIREGSQEE